MNKKEFKSKHIRLLEITNILEGGGDLCDFWKEWIDLNNTLEKYVIDNNWNAASKEYFISFRYNGEKISEYFSEWLESLPPENYLKVYRRQKLLGEKITIYFKYRKDIFMFRMMFEEMGYKITVK